MRANSCRAVASGIVLALAGCMPMEQAPLVYSSSHQIGVQVDAATPQNPGLAMSLGYKGLDAAYVPVVVAKGCPKGSTKCTDKIYEQVAVVGTSNQGNQSALVDALDRAERELNADEGRKGEAEKTLLKLRSDKLEAPAQREERVNLAAEIAKLKKPAVVTAPDGTPLAASADDVASNAEAIQVKARRLAEIPDPPSDKAFADQIEQKVAELNNLSAQVGKSEAEVNNRRQALQKFNKDDKRDAYSVYGRFDGATTGTAQGAGLSLGKVFSTGIAAQNLTQGIKEAAIVAALPISRAQCLEAVEKAIDTAPEAEKARLQARKSVCLD